MHLHFLFYFNTFLFSDTELIPLCLPVNNVTILSHLLKNWMKTSGWSTLRNGNYILQFSMFFKSQGIKMASSRIFYLIGGHY
jgi:hypothetical protein